MKLHLELDERVLAEVIRLGIRAMRSDADRRAVVALADAAHGAARVAQRQAVRRFRENLLRLRKLCRSDAEFYREATAASRFDAERISLELDLAQRAGLKVSDV